MPRLAPLFGALLLAALTPASAQVTVAWNAPTRGVSIAVDDDNNVFTLDYEQALGAEMTVTQRDVNGNLLWIASHDQTNSTQWERASWITTDSAGNAIACGTLMSGYSNPVAIASLVMKVAPNGEVLWRNVFQAGADGGTKKCLVDADDNIYVLGLGSGPPGYVTRVDRFSPAGAAVWSYFDADGIGAPVNFKLTPDHQLVIAGRAITGSFNGYARIDLDGHKVWSLAGVQSLTVGDVAGDASGNSYVVHGDSVANGGTRIKKLAPTGSILFDKAYGLSAFRIEVGSDDRAVACGFPTAGLPGAAFIKIDPAGNLLWSNLDADGPGYKLLLHAQMLLDAQGDAYLAAGTLFEMAVCKVHADGSSAWTKTTPGSFANAFALGRYTNSVFVVGGQTARLVDASEGVWTNLGQSLAGAAGAPELYGAGVLQAGSMLQLDVAHAPANALGAYVVGASAWLLPLFGGVLVPSPDVVLPLATDAYGRATLDAAIASAVPPGAGLWFHAWFFDASAPLAFSASNALVTTSP
jgi:hypothetical protein